jgi:hypothetical protein
MSRSNHDHIRSHVHAIDRCNQRGGRMLSLVDLIAAGSVDLAAAAYLAAAMQSSASLLVGARLGGAGKTAVMCALLNFLPNHTAIRAIATRCVLEDARHDDCFGETCYLAHEIGAGSYYAYVWGQDARAFFRLAARGHTIASNLHADTLEETRDQLCRENSIPSSHVDAVTLKVYLRTARGRGWNMQRWISHIYESDGDGDHLLWTGAPGETFARQTASRVVSPENEANYGDLLARLLKKNVRRIDQVRARLLDADLLT